MLPQTPILREGWYFWLRYTKNYLRFHTNIPRTKFVYFRTCKKILGKFQTLALSVYVHYLYIKRDFWWNNDYESYDLYFRCYTNNCDNVAAPVVFFQGEWTHFRFTVSASFCRQDVWHSNLCVKNFVCNTFLTYQIK